MVRVEDADQGPSGQIRSLEIIDGDPDGYFRVQKVASPDPSAAAEYNIAVLKLLDRERAPAGYNLTLRAVDGGSPPRNSTASLHVTVADWNDHAPVFDREHYDVSIVETAPVSTPLIRLRVTDQDQGRNALVQLSIVGGNQGNAAIVFSISLSFLWRTVSKFLRSGSHWTGGLFLLVYLFRLLTFARKCQRCRKTLLSCLETSFFFGSYGRTRMLRPTCL